MANENFKPDLNQPVPNGPAKTYPWLTTVSPENPSGYIKLFPTATNDSKYLQFAVETGGSGGSSGGKISWRVIDEQGNVRRQFNSVQQLADSGYNFGFDINATNITLIKNKLVDTLQQYDVDLTSGARNPSSYFTGQIPGRPVQPPPAGATPAAAPTNTPGGADPGPNADPAAGEATAFAVTASNSFQEDAAFKNQTWLRYPINMNSSQDRVVIVQKRYVPAAVLNTTTNEVDVSKVIAGGFSNRDSQFNDAKENILGTVTLPMSNDISESNTTGWGENSLSTLTGMLMSGSTGIAEDAAKGDVAGIIETFRKSFGGAFNGPAEQQIRQLLTLRAGAAILGKAGINVDVEAYRSRVTGTAINPNLELLFNGPKLRSFQFSFKMTPRNLDEARNIRYILKFFKKGMAPKRSFSNRDAAYFLGAPNVFDIHFKSGENSGDLKSIVKIKTCALQSFNVNYTPDGFYTAYNDPKAGGSQPIAVIMQLGFTELTPLYNDNYDDSDTVGFDNLGNGPTGKQTDSTALTDIQTRQAFSDTSIAKRIGATSNVTRNLANQFSSSIPELLNQDPLAPYR